MAVDANVVSYANARVLKLTIVRSLLRHNKWAINGIQQSKYVYAQRTIRSNGLNELLTTVYDNRDELKSSS